MCHGRRMGCVVVGGSLPLVCCFVLVRKIGGRLVDGDGGERFVMWPLFIVAVTIGAQQVGPKKFYF